MSFSHFTRSPKSTTLSRISACGSWYLTVPRPGEHPGGEDILTEPLYPPSLQVVSHRIEAVFLRRPNKYLGIVDLDGTETEAFIPNPGRMKELMVPGRRVLLRPAPEHGKRRTRYDLIAVHYRRRMVCIDSGVPNRFLKVLLQKGRVPEVRGWRLIRPEVAWGASRFDFLLGRGDKRCLVEAKCCTLVVNGVARFPDAPTVRGTRHLKELIEARRAGYRSVVLILVQGVGAVRFRPNRETDPDFADMFDKALDAGVEIHARKLRFSRLRMVLDEALPVGRI